MPTASAIAPLLSPIRISALARIAARAAGSLRPCSRPANSPTWFARATPQ
jgi:hypothetical protein